MASSLVMLLLLALQFNYLCFKKFHTLLHCMKIYHMKNVFELFYYENNPNCYTIAMYIVHLLCGTIKAKEFIYLP